MITFSRLSLILTFLLFSDYELFGFGKCVSQCHDYHLGNVAVLLYIAFACGVAFCYHRSTYIFCYQATVLFQWFKYYFIYLSTVTAFSCCLITINVFNVFVCLCHFPIFSNTFDTLIQKYLH